MLSQEYGCQAAYTPMFHAAHFATQEKYRHKNFSTCPEDRPLFVQFCSNNPDTILAAARYVENDCDGIDINLGCPQEIAKRGHYGAFLQDEWSLIHEMVTKLRNNLNNRLAVSCKIRRFDQIHKTVEYAKMLEKAGCSFIGLHARTREQRGVKAGLADWNFIKEVKKSVTIPVIANGNIQSLRDAEECLEFTCADAIMTAEGNLYNPCLFLDVHPPAWIVAKKYLNYVEKYPVTAGMAKSHIFKLFHRCIAMEENFDLRDKLAKSYTVEQLHDVVNCFEKKYSIPGCDQSVPIRMQPVPPYLCQPRYRYETPKKVDDVCEDAKSDHLKENETSNFNKRIKLDD